MSFLKELPSVLSSRFSRKDIELFGKYGERYSKTVKEFKDILANTQAIIDIEKENPEGNETRRDCLDKLLENNIGNDMLDCAIYSIDNQSVWWSPLSYIRPLSCSKITHWTYLNPLIINNPETDCYLSQYESCCLQGSIMHILIPKELNWIKIYYRAFKGHEEKIDNYYCYQYSEPIYGDPLLIGCYKKDFNDLTSINLSLEEILKRSKDFSFLENYGSYNNGLEQILDNSKKGLLIPRTSNKEIVKIRGEEYRKITLIHPFLFHLEDVMRNYEIEFKISKNLGDNILFYCEKIVLDDRLSDEKRNFHTLDSEYVYFCDLGPKGYKLVTFENNELKVIAPL